MVGNVIEDLGIQARVVGRTARTRLGRVEEVIPGFISPCVQCIWVLLRGRFVCKKASQGPMI